MQITWRVLTATAVLVFGNFLVVGAGSHENHKLTSDELWALYSRTCYKGVCSQSATRPCMCSSVSWAFLSPTRIRAD